MNRIFYHGVDLDGKCAGAIATKYFKEQLEYHKLYPIDYGQEFPITEIDKGDTIYFLDFSLQPATRMKDLVMAGFKVIVCDHHKTALKDFEDNGLEFDGIQDVERSGCELTWNYFYPNTQLPRAVAFLGRYDVWDKSDGKTDPFQYYCRAHELCPIENYTNWEMLFNANNDKIESFVKAGQSIINYQRAIDKDMMNELSYEIEWTGYKCLVLNAKGNSQTFTSHWDENKYDMMIMYKHVKGKYFTVSLYTTHKNIECGRLAKENGGGGHRQAAGFQCKELPWSNL